MKIRPHLTNPGSNHKTRSHARTCDHGPHKTVSGPRITEATIDLPHAAVEVYLTSGHGNAGPVTGAISAGVGVLAATRAVQKFREGGLAHNLEGTANLALAGASALSAFEMFSGHDHGHGHGHGLGAVGVLEVVHGAAEVAAAAVEIKQGRTKPSTGLLRMAKGASVVAGQLIPGAAGICSVIHLGTALAAAYADPTH